MSVYFYLCLNCSKEFSFVSEYSEEQKVASLASCPFCSNKKLRFVRRGDGWKSRKANVSPSQLRRPENPYGYSERDEYE